MSLRGGSHGPAALPVHATVAETYKQVAGNVQTFAYLAALPMLVRFAADLFVWIALASPPSLLTNLAMTLLTTMLLATFAVPWQRLTLLGEMSRQNPWQFVFERREALFFLYTLALMAPVVLALLSALSAPEGGNMVSPILMGVAFFLFVRLSLVLPAVAVDGRSGWREAWQLSQGQFWRLAAILVLVSLPPQLISLLVLLLLSADVMLVQALARLAAVVFEFLIFAITMTALALSYRWLAGPPVPVVASGPGGGATA